MQLTARETLELVASAVAIHHARLETAASGGDATADPFGEASASRSSLQSGDEVVVTLQRQGGSKDEERVFSATIAVDDSLRVEIAPYVADSGKGKGGSRGAKAGAPAEEVVINQLDWLCETPLATVSIEQAVAKSSSAKGKGKGKGAEPEPSDVERIVQYEGRVPHGYKLRFLGSQQTALVRTRREHELAQHMLPPENIDVTKYLLCPMPGTLISCAVKPGQEVESGQELAVVEAMKMQNVLRAEKRGVVKTVRSAVGAHLKVDQIIMEFEDPSAVAAKA